MSSEAFDPDAFAFEDEDSLQATTETLLSVTAVPVPVASLDYAVPVPPVQHVEQAPALLPRDSPPKSVWTEATASTAIVAPYGYFVGSSDIDDPAAKGLPPSPEFVAVTTSARVSPVPLRPATVLDLRGSPVSPYHALFTIEAGGEANAALSPRDPPSAAQAGAGSPPPVAAVPSPAPGARTSAPPRAGAGTHVIFSSAPSVAALDAAVDSLLIAANTPVAISAHAANDRHAHAYAHAHARTQPHPRLHPMQQPPSGSQLMPPPPRSLARPSRLSRCSDAVLVHTAPTYTQTTYTQHTHIARAFNGAATRPHSATLVSGATPAAAALTRPSTAATGPGAASPAAASAASAAPAGLPLSRAARARRDRICGGVGESLAARARAVAAVYTAEVAPARKQRILADPACVRYPGFHPDPSSEPEPEPTTEQPRGRLLAPEPGARSRKHTASAAGAGANAGADTAPVRRSLLASWQAAALPAAFIAERSRRAAVAARSIAARAEGRAMVAAAADAARASAARDRARRDQRLSVWARLAARARLPTATERAATAAATAEVQADAAAAAAETAVKEAEAIAAARARGANMLARHRTAARAALPAWVLEAECRAAVGDLADPHCDTVVGPVPAGGPRARPPRAAAESAATAADGSSYYESAAAAAVAVVSRFGVPELASPPVRTPLWRASEHAAAAFAEQQHQQQQQQQRKKQLQQEQEQRARAEREWQRHAAAAAALIAAPVTEAEWSSVAEASALVPVHVLARSRPQSRPQSRSHSRPRSRTGRSRGSDGDDRSDHGDGGVSDGDGNGGGDGDSEAWQQAAEQVGAIRRHLVHVPRKSAT